MDTITAALPRKAYSVAEVAEMIGKSKRTVYDLIAAGELRCVRHGSTGRGVTVPVAALEDWLGGQSEQEPQPARRTA